MPNNAMTDNNDHFAIDDTFDEKTFQLELQVSDPERRALAAGVLHDLIRLAHVRAKNENVSFADVWPHIFDWEHMRADMHGSNSQLGELAEKVHDDLENLADMRRNPRHALPPPKWMRSIAAANTNIANGGSGAR